MADIIRVNQHSFVGAFAHVHPFRMLGDKLQSLANSVARNWQKAGETNSRLTVRKAEYEYDVTIKSLHQPLW